MVIAVAHRQVVARMLLALRDLPDQDARLDAVATLAKCLIEPGPYEALFELDTLVRSKRSRSGSRCRRATRSSRSSLP